MSKLFCCSINQILRLPNWDFLKTQQNPTFEHAHLCLGLNGIQKGKIQMYSN